MWTGGEGKSEGGKKLVVMAAAQAQKAVDYILGESVKVGE